MFKSPSQNVNGVVISAKAYEILKALAAQPDAVKVHQLQTAMKDKFTDLVLYRILTDLNVQKLVILDTRIEIVKGFQFRQKYWSVVEAVKTHFAKPVSA